MNTIILRHHISDRAVEDLLSALREFGIQLPKTKKSLIKHKQLEYNVPTRDVPNGKYVHFGIENAIKKCNYTFLDDPTYNPILIDVNIDGLPLFKSSNQSLWPILGGFSNKNRCHHSVLVCG